jgi:hypothetical protein
LNLPDDYYDGEFSGRLENELQGRSKTAGYNAREREISEVEMVGGKKVFNREDFRVLVNKTYNEYYSKFRDQFNPEEYMQCVDAEQLV